jgi:DNA polymerase III subunit beta
MDITVRKTDLFKELQYVQGVVERKTTVPILSNLLLETTGNALYVTATDLDVSLRCASRATVKVAGAVTVSARKLFDIVRLLPEADVHLKSASPDWVSLTCMRSRFKVAALSRENFPDIPGLQGKTLRLPGRALRYMITRCIFAITQEESRYTLNGALMIVNRGGVTFVTTDGHRLVVIGHTCDVEGVEGEARVLVPRKTLNELSKLTSEEIDTVEFGYTENHLFFKVAERLLVSRVLSGQFPNYELVIPRENDRQVRLNTLDFADALRRAAVMADEQSHAVRFSLKEGQLEMSTATADIGEASESVNAGYAGEAIEIGFNAHYLLDFLGTLESEDVLLMLKDRETQGLMRPAEAGDFDFTYVVMPMKV